jgi:hypothetical protein
MGSENGDRYTIKIEGNVSGVVASSIDRVDVSYTSAQENPAAEQDPAAVMENSASGDGTAYSVQHGAIHIHRDQQAG